MKVRLLSLLCLSLAGCSVLTSERISCPKTSILAEFSKSLAFHKGIPIRSEMDSLLPECTQDGAQKVMDFRLRITSLRPLSSLSPIMTIKPSYFVAVVDNAGNVLSQSNHDLEVTFEDMQTTKVTFVRMRERTPVDKEVTVYIGFNLDEPQFERLQKERERNTHKRHRNSQ
jgi:hypothetical protein